MSEDHAPSHDRCDLPVEVQPLAEVEQRSQVGFAEFPGTLTTTADASRHQGMTVDVGVDVLPGDVGGRRDIPTDGQVRDGVGIPERAFWREFGEGLGRAGCHERMAARLSLRPVFGAGTSFQQPCHVFHAWAFETKKMGRAEGRLLVAFSLPFLPCRYGNVFQNPQH